MRTICFCLILAILSSCWQITTDLQKSRIGPPKSAKTWETGGGDRTHTTGHGYFQRRASANR